MQEFPHRYVAVASGRTGEDVALDSEQLPTIRSAPPVEFGGPGDRWSPETLLVAAVADCFVLTFKAIAAVSRIQWTSLSCEVAGTVDRIERVTQFTRFEVRARLRVREGTREDMALRALAKAEQTCLVTNSLKAESHLDAAVEVETPPA